MKYKFSKRGKNTEQKEKGNYEVKNEMIKRGKKFFFKVIKNYYICLFLSLFFLG